MKLQMKRSTKAAVAALLLVLPVVALLSAESVAGVWLSVIGKPRRTRVERFSPLKPSGLSSECDPVITSPVLRAGELRLGAGDSLTVAFAGKATRCPGGTVSFFTRVGSGEETAQGTAVATGGAWSKSLTVADGARTAFSVQMTSSSGRTTRTTVYVDADTSKAVVLVDSPKANDWGFARVVAPAIATGCGGGGNSHVDDGEPGWISDAACDAGGQVDPSVTVRGAVGGTLTVTWDPDGDDPATVLASAPVTASPQTFTAAELGRLTLQNASRGDLIFRAEAGAASNETVVGVYTFVTSPTQIEPTLTVINERHADVDVSYTLPAVPSDAPRATTEVGWSTSTTRVASGGSASVSIGTTPVLVPATEATRTYVMVENTSTTSEVFCALDNPAVTPATATHRTGLKFTNNGGTALIVADGADSPYAPCDGCTRHAVYCVRSNTASAISTTYRWNSWLPFDQTNWNKPDVTTRRHHCVMRDPSATPQVWECDGRTYAPGDAVTMQLRGLPPFNTLHFASRLVDGVGNASAFVAESLELKWPNVVLDFPDSSSTPAYFGARMAVGDVNGDGVKDLAVGASAANNNTGLATVFFGSATPFETIQKFYGATTGAFFGSALGLIDVNQDSFGDLIVRNGSAVDVYLGSSSGLSTSPAFQFSSRVTSIDSLPDLNGDGFAELALGDMTFNTNTGRLLVFYSRSDWSTLLVSGMVDLVKADIIVTAQSAGARLTGGNGLLNIDGFGIAIGAYGVNSVYLFPTSTLLAQGKNTTTNHASMVLSMPTGVRFGYSLGTLDADRDGFADLLIGDPYTSSLYLSRQTAQGAFEASSSRFVTAGNYFGWQITTADLNGDSYLDMGIGASSSQSTPYYIFWSDNSTLARPEGSLVFGPSTFGQTSAPGDFNGDTKIDLAIGAFSNGNGQVTVYF